MSPAQAPNALLFQRADLGIRSAQSSGKFTPDIRYQLGTNIRMKHGQFLKLGKRQNVANSERMRDHVSGTGAAVEYSQLAEGHTRSDGRQPLLADPVAEPKANVHQATGEQE
jgi:hypothetical protein